MPDNLVKSKELKVALEAALEAGKILERHLETDIIKSMKHDKSISVLADGESEEMIKKIIFEAFPEHSILGEETGMTGKQSDYVWHVDPLDGTRNYSNGIPLFAVSIALAYKRELIVGVIHNPNLNTLFYAEKGKGAYWNDKKIHVSKDEAKKGIVTVASGKMPAHKELRRNLMHYLPDNVVSAVRDFGCTAFDLAYVERGSTEADIKFGLSSYDFAAGLLLVSEAGGKITKVDGSPWNLSETSYIASNGIFHDILIEEIKKQKEKL